MLKTEQFIITSKHPAYNRIAQLSNLAARVRNQTLYRLRKDWAATGTWSEPKTRKEMRADEYPYYMLLPQKLARETSRLAGRDLKSYIRAKQTGYPANLPRYSPHTGRSTLIFSASDQLSKPKLRTQTIKVGGINQDLATIPRCGQVREVRIIPNKHTFTLEVVHKTHDKQPKQTGTQAGLDLGINNLASVIIDQPGIHPLLICGKQLKSINQRYNKEKAKQTSKLPSKTHWSKQLQSLQDNRNAAIHALLHAASRTIVNYLVQHDVQHLHIGWNTGLKTARNGLGSKFNQTFRSIPWRVLVNQITYKCNQAGIKVTETEESYTSKTSCIDGELPIKHQTYQGTRVKRGLFKTSQGLLINADINAAAQIVRKSTPNSYQTWLTHGLKAKEVLSPHRVRVGG